MFQKVKNQIDLYASFNTEIKFAIEEIRRIINWLQLARDMKVIENDEYTGLYEHAINEIVNLELYQDVLRGLAK